jgi:hypothetical protein
MPGRLWLLFALLLALVACQGGDKPDSTATPEVTPVTPEATSAVIEPVPLTPGLKVRDGLTVLAHSEGVREGTVYFFAEVRNDSGQYLSQVDAIIYPLDADNLKLGQVSAAPLMTDIPPGQVFYAGATFTAPAAYADTQRWLWYTPARQPTLRGHFGLPVTVTTRGTDENGLYRVSGTAQNDSGVDLYYPLIDVALIGPDDNLVGVTHAAVSTEREGVWPAGTQAQFTATFRFLEVPPEQVTDVRALAVGYEAPGG